jgi:hypothetical protein
MTRLVTNLARLWLALTALALATLCATAAHAGLGDNPPVDDSLAVISLGASVVTIAASAITPLLVGLATKLQASGGIKVLVASLINVAVAFIAQYVVATDGTFEVEPAAVYLFIAVVTQVSTYYGVWKPTGATAKLAPSSGIG